MTDIESKPDIDTIKAKVGEKMIDELSFDWYAKLEYYLLDENGDFDNDFLKLGSFLSQRRKKITVYPDNNQVFRVFRETPLNEVKVVIIGQDVYHNGFACGRAFATEIPDKMPASLRNIIQEVEDDVYDGKRHELLGREIDHSLAHWTEQGVLLLNTALTVEKGKAGSHLKHWEKFTGQVIKVLNNKSKPVIFLLWGDYAKGYSTLITNPIHKILKTSHPSPLSVRYGFKGCKHFSKANQFLQQHYKTEVQW